MWFHYRQNNSGGNWRGPINVLIEARDADDANRIAVQHPDSPIYFDGCVDGLDCRCCGDRWYRQWASDGDPFPSIYGEPLIGQENPADLVLVIPLDPDPAADQRAYLGL